MRKMKPAHATPTNRTLIAGHRTLLVVTMLLVILAITACGRRPEPPELEMTPASGSVDAPAEEEATSGDATEETAATDADAAPASDSDAASEEAADAAETDGAATDAAASASDADDAATASFAPGDQVVILDAAGTRVFADAADDAQVLHLYNAGEVLDVLAPSGDYDAYPVTGDDGQAWVRVRAADGLVGWVVLEAVGAGE